MTSSGRTGARDGLLRLGRKGYWGMLRLWGAYIGEGRPVPVGGMDKHGGNRQLRRQKLCRRRGDGRRMQTSSRMRSPCSRGQLAGAGGSGGAVLGKLGWRQWRLAGGAAGLVGEVRSTVGATRQAAGVEISLGVGGRLGQARAKRTLCSRSRHAHHVLDGMPRQARLLGGSCNLPGLGWSYT